jgi:cytochrome P450
MHTKVLEMHKKYGDIVRISPDEVSVIGENVWDELVGHRKLGSPENGKDPHIFGVVAKHSVLNANREDHARQRRTLSHGFSALMIEAQEPIISSYVDLLLQRLKENSDNGKNALELTSWYNWTTFDIIGDLAFGESFRCLQDSDYHPWVSLIFKRIRSNSVVISARRWGWLSKVVLAFLDQSGSYAIAAHARLVDEKLRARASMDTTRPDYYHAMTFQEDDKVGTRLCLSSSCYDSWRLLIHLRNFLLLSFVITPAR